MKNLSQIINTTNTQKVLDFLAWNPDKEFVEKEIQRATGASKPGVNLVLKKLVKFKLVEQIKKGRLSFYHVDFNSPMVKQWKVLSNIAKISPLIKSLKEKSNKIILFGSWSRGENTSDSDLDLFILTNFPKRDIEKYLKRFSSLNIQLIVHTPISFSRLEQEEPVFFKEINRGIILFEKTDES